IGIDGTREGVRLFGWAFSTGFVPGFPVAFVVGFLIDLNGGLWVTENGVCKHERTDCDASVDTFTGAALCAGCA
ncbi:MAG: hypothetical protein QM518_08455, partial [Verrucomicrobiota bacterium]|nr:hypothetical protein [Verrucomicrobiota bacterium]